MKILFFSLIMSVKSAPCQAAQFHAKEKWKSLTSPYYPDTIHAKTQCEWEIKAPKGQRVKISFDVLQLLNHRTNGRCTTQAIDIIDGPRIRDVKNDAISLCGKTKPLTDFITQSNIARVRIVSDYYGENLNNKFKIRYMTTTEPANFKGHSNDKLKTDPGGFVVRQSALSNERRVPSGPSAAPLKGDGEWGSPPKKEIMKTGIRKNLDGRVAIRSRPGFKPAVRVKSALLPPPGPTQFVHTQPPSPEEIARGYVYQGPNTIPDPNAPLSPGDNPNIPEGPDPWGMMPNGTPPPDVLNYGFKPDVVVRPAGWLNIMAGDQIEGDELEEEDQEQPSEIKLWLQEMGLDINPWLLLVGAGGVIIFIVGILIAKSVKDYRDRQELEKKQLDALARGPSGLTTITGHKSKPKSETKSPKKSPKIMEKKETIHEHAIEKPPTGFRDVSLNPSTIGSNFYTEIDENNEEHGDQFTQEVTKRLKKYKYRTTEHKSKHSRGSPRDHRGRSINRSNFRPTRR